MKIVIVGAGAVGGYYGARLSLAGHDVSFVVRTPSSAAALQAGISITSELGNIHLRDVRAFTNPLQAGLADLIIIAVKLWDTEAALRNIMPIVDPETSVISLQNGVEKDDVTAAIVGRCHLLGAVTYIVVNRDNDGVIVHSGTHKRIILGEFDGTESVRVQEIVNALLSGGIDAESSPDIRRSTWEKFIFLASISAVTAATRETIGVVRSRPADRMRLQEAMCEAAAVAQAEGVAISDTFVDERMRFVDTFPPDGRSSMANDLLRGSKLELEWLSGAVVRRARSFNIPTPVHAMLYAKLSPFVNGNPSHGDGPMKVPR